MKRMSVCMLSVAFVVGSSAIAMCTLWTEASSGKPHENIVVVVKATMDVTIQGMALSVRSTPRR